MKRILFLLVAFVAFAINVQAQESLLSEYSLASDTVTNTATVVLTSPVIKNKGYVTSCAVQVVATKISGTVAGSISVLGSMDGTNFASIGSAATATDVTSQSFAWNFAGNPYLYYRISWTGTGTMAASFTAKVLQR